MRKNVEKFAGHAIVGVVAIAGYELIKTAVQVIKDKRALKGIAQELENIDQLVEAAEKVKVNS